MYQPQLIEVDPQRIKFNPLNPRRHQGMEFDRLKQSVREVGIVQLPTVRVLPGGFYEVIDGEGRIRTAQEKRSSAIWAISLGIVNDHDALTMLQSANSVRSFSFFAECRGIANLNRQGQTIESIAKQVGRSKRTLQTYAAIGYFPDQLIEMMQTDILRREAQGEGDRKGSRLTYGYNMLQDVLPLRQLRPGKEDPSVSGVIDGTYDYTEVQRVIEQVIQGDISNTDQLKAYVEQRRRELFEKQFNEEMRKRLEAELAQTKQALEASFQQQLQGVQEQTTKRYEAQVAVLQRQYQDLDTQYQKLVKDVAKRPEVIAEREKQLQQKLKDAEAERARFQTLQQQVQQEVQKTQQEARAAIQRELSEAIKEQRKTMEQQLAQARADMEAYYAQKSQQLQLKATTSFRQSVAHETELSAQWRQSSLNIMSGDMIKGFDWLSDAEKMSLLAEVVAVRETSIQMEEALRHRMQPSVTTDEIHIEEGSSIHGR